MDIIMLPRHHPAGLPQAFPGHFAGIPRSFPRRAPVGGLHCCREYPLVQCSGQAPDPAQQPARGRGAARFVGSRLACKSLHT